ncbi:AERO1 [Ecytonucleospora hepatopenaei]|uniref:AERO1 n=1 Tax=Ecytonucleospora hepatopenaei TaxID=646526 RepID=A0A1W0E6H8_9MICR|nr:AERO1 [Ecytonucleospora hepatopenaei]
MSRGLIMNKIFYKKFIKERLFTPMKIFLFSLQTLCTDFKETELEVESLNNEIYGDLRKLASTELYSKIKINFYDKCPRVKDDCTYTSCEVPTIKYGDKEGVIDLLSVIESFSPGIKHSNLVWNDIYKTTEDQNILKIISGLHFSVTTHIAAFHTKIFGFYVSNPRKFINRYNEVYKNNFLNLYKVVRTAVGHLKNIPADINDETRALSNKIRIKALPVIETSVTDVLDKCIACIACLNCEKCILWGTIQTRGLKSVVKVLNNKTLYRNDVIYLINLFRRLSESVKQSRRMKNVLFPNIYLPIVYYKQFTILILAIFLMVYMNIRRKLRKIKVE